MQAADASSMEAEVELEVTDVTVTEEEVPEIPIPDQEIEPQVATMPETGTGHLLEEATIQTGVVDHHLLHLRLEGSEAAI